MTDERWSHVTVLGQDLEYRWLGPGPEQAPTVVFLHEGLGSAELWRDLPDRVAAATGCGVLQYSRHGYGRSSRKPHPWRHTYLHDEAEYWLPRILDALAVRHVVLVGHSDGGSISAIAAGLGVVRQLEGVALLAPHVMAEPATRAGVQGAIEAFEKARLRDHLRRYHGDNTDDVFWGWALAWEKLCDDGWDVRPLLEKVRVPVLVVQGDDDEYGSAEQYRSIQARVPGGAEVRVLPQCRHLLYRDRPAEVTTAVSDFVRRVLGGVPLWVQRDALAQKQADHFEVAADQFAGDQPRA